VSRMSQDKLAREIVCETCGNQFLAEASVINLGNRLREYWPQQCPACRDRQAAEDERLRQSYLVRGRQEDRIRWRQQSGMPEGLISRTFENFEAGWQDKALNICRKYAEGFKLEAAMGYRSLILYSPSPGVGKTHLVVAIANYVTEHWEGEPGTLCDPIRFESGPGLVRRVRATYGFKLGAIRQESEMEIYEKLKGVRLLILDDVGKEKPSDFTRELYWYLINERVASALPVLMTCRLPLEGTNSLQDLMGTDTVDRLYGMARGRIEILEGGSYRKFKKVA
jgi:DNA replication protein DnaC